MRYFRLLVFVLACSTPIANWAFEFEELDFLAEIRSHRLYQQFDPESRRFLGTDSAFRNIASLGSELASVERELAETRTRLGKLVQSVASPGAILDQENFWTTTREMRSRLDSLQSRQQVLREQISLGTWTSDISILPYIRQIARDVVPSRGPEKIVLNRLPAPGDQVNLGETSNAYLEFFRSGEPSAIKRHRRKRGSWWRRFPMSGRALVWSASTERPGGGR